MTRLVPLLIAGIASMLAGGAQADWIDTFAGGEPEQFWAFRYNPTNSGSVAYASGTSATTMGSLTVTTGGTNWIGYGVVPTNSFAGTGVVVRSVVNPFGSTLAGPRVGVVAQVDPALGTGYLATIDTSATNGTSTLSLNKAAGSGGSTTSLGTATIPAFSATGKYTVELQVLGPLVNARVYDEFDTLVAQTSASDSSPYGSGFAGVGLWAGTSGTSAAPMRGTWGTTAAAGVAGPGGALIWAPNGGVPSGTAAVATGTWTTGAATWLSTTGTAPSAWNPTKTAYFGGTGLSSGGSVVVSGTSGVSVAAGMKFEVGGYRITGTSGGQIVLVSSTQQIDVGPQFTATISAPLSGTAALEKVGLGTLVLDGSNSYGGGTRITRGTLIISSSAAVPRLATGGVSVSPNATLAVTNGVTNATVTDVLASGSIGNGAFGFDTSAGDRTYAASISGSLSLVKLGGNSLTLTGTNTYAGLTTVSSGTLRIDGPAALPGSGTPGRFVVAPGAVLMVTNTVSDPTVVAMLATGNVRAGGFGFDTAAGDRAFSSSISGSLSLVKAGNNTLTLTGTNSYSGGSIVSAGILRGSVTSLQGTITNNAAVVFDQATAGSYAGMMAGSGSLTKLGAGELTLSGANSYSGGTLVSAGVLRGNATSLQGTITNNTTVVFDQLATGTYAGLMSGPGSLTKLGAGELTLTGTNSYFGGTLVSTGTLRGSVTSLQGPITNNAAVVFDQATAGTYSGVMVGSGSLTKLGGGELTLTASNSYSGGTIVSTGTLRGNVTSLQGAIVNNAAVVFDQATTGTYSGMMSGFGGLTKLGVGTLKLTGSNSYFGGTRVSSGTLQGDSVSLTGNIANSAALEFAQATSGTYGGSVSGTGSLVKSGSGTLTLSGTSTYTGQTWINEGLLVMTSTTALPGSGAIPGTLTVSSSAALVVGNGISNTVVTGIFTSGNLGSGNFGFDTSAGDRAYSTPISGSMTLIKLGANQLTLQNFTGINTYAGARVLSGTLRGTTSSLVGTISIADSAAVLFDQSTSGTFSGVATGSGRLVKTGLGTLTLSGSNSYSGGTLVSAGTLLGNATSLQGPITNNTAVVFDQLTTGTYAGLMSGSGSLTKLGAGTLTLTGANTYSGTTQITAGVLALGSPGALGSAGAISFGGGTLQFSSSNQVDYSSRFSANQQYRIDTAGQSVSFGSPLTGTAGSLTKIGSGTLTLAAANTYSGTTRVAAGTLALSNTGALAASTLDMNVDDSGSVAFAGSGATYTLGGLQGSRDLTIGSNSIAVGANGKLANYSGVLSGSGSLTKTGAGTFTLNGSNAYSGGTQINDGVLALGSPGALGSSGTIAFGGGTLQFSGANTADYSSRFSNALNQQYRIDTAGQSVSFGSPLTSPDGSLTKIGSGTLTLTGSNTYSGGTQINDGVLALGSPGALGSSGTISFGGGTLQFSGANTADYSNRFSKAANQQYLIDTAGQSVSFGSPLTSTNGSLTKLGSGTLTLAAANTYGGTTRVAAGTLALSNTGALAASTLDMNAADFGSVSFAGSGATYTFGGLQGSRDLPIGSSSLTVGANGQSTDYSGVLSGSGSLTKTGAGTLTLAAANTYSGTTRVAAGTLALADPQALAGSTLDMKAGDLGSVAFAMPGTQTYTLGGLQGSRNLDTGTNSLVVGGNGQSTEYTGVFSGSGGSLTKSGTGILTLANSFSSGTTRVGAGALIWSATSAQTGTTTVASTAAFGLRATGTGTPFTPANIDALFKDEFPNVSMSGASVAIDVNSGSFTYALPADRGLFKVGAGTLVLNTSTSTYNSTTTIRSGTLEVLSTNALGIEGSSGTIAFEGGTLRYSASGTTDYSRRFSNAPNQQYSIDTAEQSVSFGAPLTSPGGSLTKLGTGTLILTEANTYTGPTTISGGTLSVGSGSATGSLASGSIANAGALVVNRSGTLTIAGAITGTGSLAHVGTGTTTLTGPNTYTGTTTISAGRLIGSTTSLPGPITNNAAVEFVQATTGIFASVISGTGSVTKSGAGTLTLTEANTYTGPTTISGGTLSVGSGSATGSLASGSIANAGALVVNRTGNLTIAGAITGTGSLAHVGNGTTTLTGVNTYTGTTTVSAGRLIGSTTSLQGAITNNAAVEFAQDTAGTYSGTMSGMGALVKTGAGLLALTAANTYSGATTISGGTLSVGNGGATGSLASATIANAGALVLNRTGTLTLAGAITGTGSLAHVGTGTTTLLGTNTYTGTTTVSAGRLIGSTTSLPGAITNNAAVEFAQATTGTYSGTMSGGGSLTKSGTGTLELTAANTYSGATTISGGTLSIGNGDATGSIASSSIVNAGALVVNRTGALTIAGAITGTGSLAHLGTGITTLSGSNTYTGTTTVSAGRLIGSTTSLPGPITNNAAVEFAQATTGTFASVISGTGLLTKSGTGTLELTGANSYAGGTIVSAGTLLGNATSLRGAITNNASVVFNQTTTGTGTYAGIMSGSGLLTKSGTGTLELTGPNSYSGGTLVSVGTLLGNATSLQGTITNYASVVFNQTTTGTYSGIMAGTGLLTKIGTGTLTLSNTNYLTGSTTVQQGTLQLANEAALASSRIVPLAGGTVSLTPYLQTTVGGLAPNAGGLVNVGSGKVTVVSGLTATDLVTAIVAGRGDGSWTGTSGITSNVAAANVALSIPRAVGWLDDGDGYMTAAYAAPGDTNIDWWVDVLDAGNFLSFGKFDTGLPSTWQEGDFNYDVVVDILDAADFFNTALYDTGSYNPPAGAAGSVAAVPEPSSGAALAITILVASWLVCRRRT
jgi:autotransporter-associated beta strand protein